MITIGAFLAAVVAAVALAVWLWLSPDVRAWLAAHLAPIWAAVRRHRGRLVVAASGLATVLTLVRDGFAAAIPIALVTALIWLCRRLMREADEDALKADARAQWLTGNAKRAADSRDSALDALAKLVAALESAEGYDVEAALDASRWVLNGNDFTGRLRGVQNGLEEAEGVLDRLRGLPSEGVDAHAARIIAIFADIANQVEPADRIDAIRARINGSTP